MDYIKEIKKASNAVFDILGSGYLENVYEEAISHELRLRKIAYERQRNFEILYKGYKVGEGRADFILNPLWCAKSGKETVIELKAIRKITEAHKRQTQVYMISLNIEKGAVLSFGDKILLETVTRPKKELDRFPAKPIKSKKDLETQLIESANCVFKYFGSEFIYREKGLEIFPNAIGTELRLNGIEYSSGVYEILYKHHPVCEFHYDFVFDNNITANVFYYKKDEEIIEQVDDLKNYKKDFKLNKCFLICIPSKEGEKVQLKVV